MRVLSPAPTGFLGHYIVNQSRGRQRGACRCWYRPDSDQGGFEAAERQIEWVSGDKVVPQQS